MASSEQREAMVVQQLYVDHDAIWAHDGNPQNPHAQLSNDQCSNGFLDSRKVLRHPLICRALAKKLYYRMLQLQLLGGHIGRIAGSSYSAMTFSHEFAACMTTPHDFTEKDPADPTGKRMIWKGEPIGADEPVLQIEELVTSRRTTLEVRRAMQAANPVPIKFLPVVGCIAYRPESLAVEHEGIAVVSLFEMEIWTSDPENCPLCKAGSERLRPRGNWAKLTGKK